MTARESLFSARIVTAPFVHHDGQVDVRSYLIESPQSVELDGLWVHVVEHDNLGGRTLIRSYPSHEIQRVEWREGDEA